MNENTKNNTQTADSEIAARVNPILEHLKVEGTEIDLNVFRKKFIEIWKFEEAGKLPPEDQFLTTVAVFIYTAHNAMDDYNIRIDRARESIVAALEGWKKQELDQMVAQERASEKPFKAFVDNHLPQIDEIYTWKNFFLDHKQADENQWTYKMKKCWFTEFFIRFGRVDYIETACMYDQIPWKARKDYVDLKLNNMFRKLGKICQFNYKPAKPGK
ncbi:MAG: hypothetical protein ACE5E9_05100 [Nitrospinaceae bacterium]